MLRLRTNLLVAVLLFSGAAHAQPAPPAAAPTPSAADAATAKRHFESGLKLYSEGAYAEALIAFDASYRLGGRASALKNVAQCHRDLKHFVDAYEAYEKVLSNHSAQLKEPERVAVRHALDELVLLTGTLAIAVSEPGADIEVDGKSLGQSPLAAPKRVSVGSHRLRVTKAGFEPFAKEVGTASQEDVRIEAKLEPESTSGHVSIREPQGDPVNVFIDGADKGPLPWEGDLPAGSHVIEAKGPKFASEKRTVTIAKKERLDLVVDATTLLGRLRLTTTPATASISVDGRAVATGMWDGELEEGTHQIEVRLEGHPSVVRTMSIRRGETVVEDVPVSAGPAAPIATVPVYKGVYGRLALEGSFALSEMPSNAVAGTVQSNYNGGFGAGLSLHVGYSFDPLSIEIVTRFMFAHQGEERKFSDAGIVSSDTLELNMPGIFVGAGPRITSRDDSVRFTAGLALGVAYRSLNLNRNNNNGSGSGKNDSPIGPSGQTNYNGDFSQSASYTDPAFAFDAGMLLGSTPGTKFYLGVQAWVDFAPNMVMGPDTSSPRPNDTFASPGRGYAVLDGPQVYIGPTLGMQFGH